PPFEDLWVTHGAMLRYQLQAGAKVLLHCFAGLGRTGTIAARLLVEFGAQPSKAIDTVRTARRGAVQTTSQEEHVRLCARVS
ncbi:MAG: protein-tyrosine phosphatase family protein, partial [Gammaproteobacteria bacterium]